MKDIVKTDHQLREVALHGSDDFAIEYYVDNTEVFGTNRVNQHWHSEVEFAYIRRGTATFQIGNEFVPVNCGDGIFINSKAIHGYAATEKTIVPNIVFSPDLIAGMNQAVYRKLVEPIISSGITYLFLSKTIDWQNSILNKLLVLFELMLSDEETKELDVQQTVTSIWRILYMNRASCFRLPRITNIQTQVRLRTMLLYIYNHYSQKISLLDIASAANISKNEALRCFREEIATSPIDYLNKFRLDKACKRLLTTDHSISEVSLSVGFESSSYFNRLFKKTYGIPPTAFRKRGLSATDDHG